MSPPLKTAGSPRDSAVLLPGQRDMRRRDFTYQTIVGQTHRSDDYRQSLFIGTSIQDCRFAAVSFDRCDFSGTKIVNCDFENCSLAPDDFRACLIVGSRFKNCSFKGSLWHQMDVKGGIFEECDFRESSIRESHFSQSHFVKCRFRKSSITLNEFTACAFGDVNLGDCTALFLIFNACQFDRCRINAETIGFTFGLSEANLNALGLIYLGKRQRKLPTPDLVGALLETYENRQWNVGLCVLQLNFDRAAPLVAIRRLVDRTIAHFDRALPLDWDEYRFVVDVLDKMSAQGRLPMAGVWLLTSALSAASTRNALDRMGSSTYVIDRLERILVQQLDGTGQVWQQFPPATNLTLALVLRQRPLRALDEVMPKSMLQVLGGDKLDLISARSGSWHELWRASSDTLVALQISLLVLNGVTTQILKSITTANKLVKMVWPAKKAAKRPKRRSKALQSAAAKRASLSLDIRINISNASAPYLHADRLTQIETAIHVAARLDDDAIEDLQAYAAKNIVAASVTVPKSTRKGRAHRRAV